MLENFIQSLVELYHISLGFISVERLLEVLLAFRMLSFSNLLDDGSESIEIIGRVRNYSCGSVGFIQGVLAVHFVSVADLPVAFVVAGVRVFDTIFEFVLWIRVVIVVLTFLLAMMLEYGGNWGVMMLMEVTMSLHRRAIVFDFNFVLRRLDCFARHRSSESC